MPIQYSKVTTGPLVEPVDIDDIAKLDLKVDDVTEDGLIEILIQAARELVEEETQSSLITQTRVIKMDYFPQSESITLPFGPIQDDHVITVSYYDSNEDLQEMDAADYWIDTHSRIPRIVVKDSWPETYDRPNAVEVEYECGYGDAGSDVPAPLRKAILLLLGHLYENRQNVIVSGSPTGVIEIPYGARVLMAPYVLEQNISY